MFGFGPVMAAWSRALRSLDETRAAKRKLVVEHVRYVKQPAITYRAKAHAIALSIGRTDLAEKLK